MTRGASPGRSTAGPAGTGPGIGQGSFSLAVGSPVLRLARHGFRGHGEICLACDRPIYFAGVRLTWSTLTTHAHRGCAGVVVRALA